MPHWFESWKTAEFNSFKPLWMCQRPLPDSLSDPGAPHISAKTEAFKASSVNPRPGSIDGEQGNTTDPLVHGLLNYESVLRLYMIRVPQTKDCGWMGVFLHADGGAHIFGNTLPTDWDPTVAFSESDLVQLVLPWFWLTWLSQMRRHLLLFGASTVNETLGLCDS